MTQRSDALAAGYELDRYRIERMLGEGGFGITYLARHIHTGKPVAIKEYLPSEFALRESNSTVLPRGGKSEDAYRWGLARFMDEAKTLETFAGHPNIVVVRDFFEANGTAYLVMQYEEGQTFGQWLADHPHPAEQQLLDIFIPILDGLREVHSKQFLHRDIKPGNIYLRTNGTPLLIDFGSSRQALGEHSKSLSVVLTEGYAAKEQYSKRGNQGAWTDIYAVGATLWRSISGEDPEPAPDRGEARDSGHPDPLRPAVETGRGRYSEGFLKAIDWALAYDPQNRPQTVHEWQNLLLNNQSVPKPSPKPIPQPIPTPPTPRPIPAPTQKPSSVGQWSLIASGVLVLAGGGYYWLGQSSPIPSSEVQTPPSTDQPIPSAQAASENTQVPASITPPVNTTPKPTETVVTIGNYIIHGNGTVTDTDTGLMWKQCSEGQNTDCSGDAAKYKWDEAISSFNGNVQFANFNDWRMPTKDELRGLVYCSNGTLPEVAWDHNCSNDNKAGNYQQPTINVTAFPNTPAWRYWSSSEHNASDSWAVGFDSGVDYWSNRNDDGRVRLVRWFNKAKAEAETRATTAKMEAEKAAAAKSLELAKMDSNLTPADERPFGSYAIQLLATSDKAKADSVARTFWGEGYKTYVNTVKVNGKNVYRSVAGGYTSKEAASAAQARMKHRYSQNRDVQNSFVTSEK
jgi:serine/threonine protein kinase